MAREIAAYQKHRIERLQRQGEATNSGYRRSRATTCIGRRAKSPRIEEGSVPKAMAAHYQTLVALTDKFSHRHLNEEYAELARRAAAALCRKRPSPVFSGQSAGWACGILYALRPSEFPFSWDKSSTPSMSMLQLCAGFGVAATTGGSKAKAVRNALGIRRWEHRWLLPANIASLPMAWMIEVDGFPGRCSRPPSSAPGCRVRTRPHSLPPRRRSGRARAGASATRSSRAMIVTAPSILT